MVEHRRASRRQTKVVPKFRVGDQVCLLQNGERTRGRWVITESHVCTVAWPPEVPEGVERGTRRTFYYAVMRCDARGEALSCESRRLVNENWLAWYSTD